MILNIFFLTFLWILPLFIGLNGQRDWKSGNVKKSGPEKVRILHKSSEFHYYSSLEPVVRNAKFWSGGRSTAWCGRKTRRTISSRSRWETQFFQETVVLLSGMTHTRRENFIDNWRWQMATFWGYVEIICFRTSCRRGRSSSSSPPGIVREDEKLVNTVPVVCFCRFWRNCMSKCQKIQDNLAHHFKRIPGDLPRGEYL